VNTVAHERFAVLSWDARRWLLVLPPVLYALLVFPFVYHDVLGEPDLERMALGLTYGTASGLHAAAGYHYNYPVSFGYYQALYHLLPPAVMLRSSALIATINYVGFAAAVLAIAMLGLYLRRLFGVLPAFLACVLFAFSPVFLDLGTSGHPQLPGFALLLLGAWLLTFVGDPRAATRRSVAVALIALVVLFAAMTVRADVALAFPFMTLMGPEQARASRREWLRASGLRLLVTGATCILWLAVVAIGSSHDAHDAGGQGYVASFFEQFYKAQTVPRGFVVFVLCMGMATTVGLLVLLRGVRALSRLQIGALVLLALPTLVFWIPNSTPGRHLLLAYLAAAVLGALLLSRDARAARPRGWASAIAIACGLVLANQAIAEAAHGVMVRHYSWVYPLLTARRATTSAPLGAFPLDHQAKQESFEVLREEGRDFARACSGHVLVISEEPHFMMMSLIELDPTVQLRTLRFGPDRVFRASGRRCTADFIEKQAPAHRDPLPALLASREYAGWKVYFQESRRNAFDRTPVPAERRFCLGPSCTAQ
jgi:hypothetical protein